MSEPAVITSLTNATVKLLAGLRLQKFRDEHDLFLMEGLRTLRDAQRIGTLPKVFAYQSEQAADKDVQALIKACRNDGGTIIAVTEDILRKITHKDNPQPVVAAYGIARRSFGDVEAQSGDIFIALEQVRDPGNLGTIIRTADAVGASGVLLIGPSCDPYAPEVTRASTGSIFHVPVFQGKERDFVDLARTWPGSVIGTAMTGQTEYRTTKYQTPALIVMGTEQKGLSEVVERACSVIVRIPMPGRAESLNLAIASAVMLYGVRESLPAN